jgi:hypothetical protein
MYANNPDGITWRVKQVLAKALGRGPSTRTAATGRLTGRGSLSGPGLYRQPGRHAKGGEDARGLHGLHGRPDPRRSDGGNGGKPGVGFLHLNEIERAAGCPIVRGKRRALKTDGLQSERGNGKRRASVRDFHSFRVTWITLALAAGVPLELVQRVTGHRTVEVVMKHYFRPGREDFRQAILRAMPKMLGISFPARWRAS